MSPLTTQSIQRGVIASDPQRTYQVDVTTGGELQKRTGMLPKDAEALINSRVHDMVNDGLVSELRIVVE